MIPLLQVVGMYSELGDINGPLSQAIPPPPANDRSSALFNMALWACRSHPYIESVQV